MIEGKRPFWVIMPNNDSAPRFLMGDRVEVLPFDADADPPEWVGWIMCYADGNILFVNLDDIDETEEWYPKDFEPLGSVVSLVPDITIVGPTHGERT